MFVDTGRENLIMTKIYTLEEVAKHNSVDDCWVVIDGKIYDVTSFLPEHPGGKKVVVGQSGKDASQKFHALHDKGVLEKYGQDLYIGDVASKIPGGNKINKFQMIGQQMKTDNAFGAGIPYGDPNWYQDWNSPYYNDSHRRFRAYLRDFVEREIMPYTHEWDEAKKFPKELFKKLADAGLLGFCAGAPWPSEYCGTNLAGGTVSVEEYDHFHELIFGDELSRCGSGGIIWGLLGGLSIGLPPVLRFGSQYLKDKVGPGCLNGDKVICLAITEPYAGSDVANLLTEAKKTEDGKHYIVNGEKKWITNGVFADYFTVAVRTGGPGMKGVSLLLIERTMPGVTTRQMKCSGVWPSGTTYITFEDVKVPVENIIGKENKGFRYIMLNFNSERLAISIQASRFARVCLEEAIKHAYRRKTFGKRLIDHPVIRMKIAHMARQCEATHAWLENIVYQMDTMSYQEQQVRLGGPIALLKAQTTITFEYCAREAAQIYGGLAYTRGGQGEKVERLYREVRAFAIPAGSEEIMLDLGVRQAMRFATL